MADWIGAKKAYKSKRALTEIYILEEEVVPAGSMDNTAYLNSLAFNNIKYEILANNQESIRKIICYINK